MEFKFVHPEPVLLSSFHNWICKLYSTQWKDLVLNEARFLQWLTASPLGRLGLSAVLDKIPSPESDRLSRLSIFTDMQQWLETEVANPSEIEATRPTMQSLISGEELWNCNLCRKMFVSKYYFQRHMKCHLTKKELCPYCPFRSTYKWNLKSHIRNKHKDKMPLNHL